MIQTILTLSQAIAVGAFLISATCCFILKNWGTGIINLSLFFTNFFVFYGHRIFK